MALAIRFIPNPGRTVIYTPSGRTYNVTGPTVDIPFPDADAVATDHATRLMVVGATADRPVGGPDRIGWRPPGCTTQHSASRSFWFRDRTRRAGWILRARQFERASVTSTLHRDVISILRLQSKVAEHALWKILVDQI
jgi:hypothetical protein